MRPHNARLQITGPPPPGYGQPYGGQGGYYPQQPPQAYQQGGYPQHGGYAPQPAPQVVYVYVLPFRCTRIDNGLTLLMMRSQQQKNDDSDCFGCLAALLCCCCLGGTPRVLRMAFSLTDRLRFVQRCVADGWGFHVSLLSRVWREYFVLSCSLHHSARGVSVLLTC